MNNDYKDKILSFYHEHKRLPVYTEIMRLVGFKSKNAVHKLINRLVEEGVLAKDSSGHLIPDKSISAVPLLGLVEAGFPAVAEAELLDTLDINDYLVPNKSATYLLRVKGESMIEAGIQDGDMVIAERIDLASQSRTKEAKDGDIVIALIDGGWTMKYFRKRKGKVYLEPANKDFENIYPESQLEITAIVKGVIRKY